MIEPLHNSAGERLDCAFHDGAQGAQTAVVIGHGVTANKDRAFLVALAEGLAAAGIPALRLSFAGNGDSDGRFEDATVTKEVEDLGAALDAVADLSLRAAYVGHSMGGAVGVLRAARDDRITALVSLAGMLDCADFYARKFGDQTPGASVMWDKPECPLSPAFQADMQAIGSLEAQAATIGVPWLLVHGTADTVVLPRDAHAAVAAAPHATLIELDGADHLFSGDATPAMVAAVVPWLVEQLQR